jgi:hypothetical protein
VPLLQWKKTTDFFLPGTIFHRLRSNQIMASGLQWERRRDDGRCGMAVPGVALNYVRPTATVFELEALEGLPCGCVAAAYRARPWDVAVVSLEAKGPHCILSGHASGQILRLGDPSEFDEEEEDE